MSKYGESDASKDTGSSGSDTTEAWHTARDDSGAREGKDSFDKAPDWAKDNESGPSLFPKGKK
mgnify:CR=1